MIWEQTTYDDLDEIWFEAEEPKPEGAEISLDYIGREDMGHEEDNRSY